jgi:hypothetical protein
MKQLINGFVYYVKYDFSDEPQLHWNQSATMGNVAPAWVLVGPHNFEVECPDDFDPRPAQIAALDHAIQLTRAEFTARLTELQEQKQRLLAIENTVDA